MARRIPSRPVIGVTGGIGSGKSLVAAMLGELGCRVIDADKIGHALLRRPEVIAALAERFGPEVVGADGAVDRRQVARRAFADSRSLAGLNEIMHPPLRAELAMQIDSFRADAAAGPAAAVDAALLLETDWHTLCDVLVFVDAADATRRRRAGEEKGWGAAEWARRENLQKPLDFKRTKSDHVVGNNSTVSRLQEQVRLLYQQLVSP